LLVLFFATHITLSASTGGSDLDKASGLADILYIYVPQLHCMKGNLTLFRRSATANNADLGAPYYLSYTSVTGTKTLLHNKLHVMQVTSCYPFPTAQRLETNIIDWVLKDIFTAAARHSAIYDGRQLFAIRRHKYRRGAEQYE
jgi:hypothetical protein